MVIFFGVILRKAGFGEQRIVECHGSIHWIQSGTELAPANDINIEVDEEKFEAKEPLPHLHGRLARPNVLMFGDSEWISSRTDQQYDRMNRWFDEIAKTSECRLCVIELGAGLAIPTVRLQSESTAKQFAGTLIRINPRDYDVPHGISHISIPLGALAALQKIEKYYDEES
jgi:NAD-dependent SIR2 family protein deacetylase